jgi:ABC-type Co2+ transport system permease subunit
VAVTYSRRMGRRSRVRILATAGLSTVPAVLAHGGAAGLRTAPWVAAAGSAIVALALFAAVRHAARLQARVEGIAAGDLRLCVEDREADAGLLMLAGWALACQAGAHAGLLAAGVHTDKHAIAAPTLHVILALLTAAAAYALDRLLARLASAVTAAVQTALALLLAISPAPQPVPLEAPRSHAAPRGPGGRAPPRAV